MFGKGWMTAAVFLLAMPVMAANAPAVTFSDVTLPMTPGTNGAAFLTVTSQADDTITGATSDCCAAVELHRHEMDGDVMRMRRVDAVPLKAGVPVVFAPGGLHVMLIGLKHPLAAGDAVKVTFTFAHAPAATAVFTAAAPRLHDAAESSSHR